jgi:hypothetical protein
MTKTFTREQLIELTTAVMKAIVAEVDLSERQLDVCVDVVSATLIKSLQATGYQLPWIKTVRRN